MQTPIFIEISPAFYCSCCLSEKAVSQSDPQLWLVSSWYTMIKFSLLLTFTTTPNPAKSKTIKCYLAVHTR